MRIERISQPGKVDIQAAQGRQPALIIVDGHRIGGIGKGVRPVEIRVCPGGPQVIQGPEEFRILAIIVLRRAKLLGHNTAIRQFVGIGLKKTADGRIVIRHEGQATAHHVGIVVDQTHHNREKGIRIVQVPHDVPLVLCHGGFRKFQHMLYLVNHGTQYRLAA